MNDAESTRAITILRDELPSFAGVLDELCCYFDEDLSVHTVFSELAEIASRFFTPLGPCARDEQAVQEIFAALETVAGTTGVDPVEAVAFGFLDQLSGACFPRVLSYLHPVTEWLYERLIAGELDGWPDLAE